MKQRERENKEMKKKSNNKEELKLYKKKFNPFAFFSLFCIATRVFFLSCWIGRMIIQHSL